MVIRFSAFFFPFRENSFFSRLVCLKRLYTAEKRKRRKPEWDNGKKRERRNVDGKEEREECGAERISKRG